MLMEDRAMVRYELAFKSTLTVAFGLDLDVNECATNNGNCSQICTNTIGSYACLCLTGYKLNIDNKTCAGEYASCLAAMNIHV